MNAFKAPVMEMSWDDGKTWTEGWNMCRAGMLARIVAPDGNVLWQGRGVAVEKICEGCQGKGVQFYYEFRKE